MQTSASRRYLFSFIQHFIFSGVLLAFTYFYFGSYYEEYQGFWNALFSESLSPGTTFDNFYFLGYIGISYIYSFIQSIFPSIQWFSVFHFLQLNISFALFFSIIAYLLRKLELKAYWLYLIFTLVFFGLFLDNIILFVYARASYILCAASYLAIIVFFKDMNVVKKYPFVFGILILLFLWGNLTRIESALAASLLLFCFAVVWKSNLKNALLISAPIMLIVGLSLILVFLDINTSTQFHKQVEPNIETEFTVRFNVVPVSSMKTFEDSVKYEAAMRMFWADPDIITIPYLKSLVKQEESRWFNPEQWNRVKYELQTAWNNFKFHFVFVLLLTGFSFVLLIQNTERIKGALLVLYLLGFIILLIENSYFVKMRDRTISPYLLIYLFSVLLLVFRYLKGNRRAFNFTIFILFVWAGINLVITKNKSELLNEVRQGNIVMLNKVKVYCSGETLMPNPTAMGNVTLAFTPFEKFDFSMFDHLYFYEASIQSIIPPYYQYLSKECNCEVRDFSNFYRYVLNPEYPNKVYTLSNEDRMIMAMVYLKIFHNLEIQYEKVKEVDLNENLAMDYFSKRKLYLYQISLAK